MSKRLKVLAFSLAILTALTGCAGKLRYPTYYTLNLPPAADPPAARGVRSSIAVREFQCPVYLRQGPIVYRATPEQLGFYEYHRWAEDPRQVVTQALVTHLRASGKFSSVLPYAGRSEADYVVSGNLEKLEEVDYEGGVKVEVAISARLTRVSTGATAWSNAVSESAPVAGRNVSVVVSQMNRTMEVAISKLLSTLPNASAIKD